jgi:hypothetical protein
LEKGFEKLKRFSISKWLWGRNLLSLQQHYPYDSSPSPPPFSPSRAAHHRDPINQQQSKTEIFFVTLPGAQDQSYKGGLSPTKNLKRIQPESNSQSNLFAWK